MELKGGPKYKITYCHAKRHFEVFKIHNLDVKLVCYIKEAMKSIFLTAVRLFRVIERQEKRKNGFKRGPKYRILYYEAKKRISKRQKFKV